MNKKDFIDWLSSYTAYERTYSGDDEWRELMNYAEYIWDELTIENESVLFRWEECGWGYTEYRTREYSFEEFIERYTNYELKY